MLTVSVTIAGMDEMAADPAGRWKLIGVAD
jgi:hypothetical protein